MTQKVCRAQRIAALPNLTPWSGRNEINPPLMAAGEMLVGRFAEISGYPVSTLKPHSWCGDRQAVIFLRGKRYVVNLVAMFPDQFPLHLVLPVVTVSKYAELTGYAEKTVRKHLDEGYLPEGPRLTKSRVVDLVRHHQYLRELAEATA